MGLTISRDGRFPLDGVRDRQRALADNTSRYGKKLLLLLRHHLHLGLGREPSRATAESRRTLRVFRGGLNREALGRRDSSIENISSRGAKDKVGVVPDFTSRLSQSDTILEGDRGRRFPVLRSGVKIVNRVPLSVRNAW